MMDSVGDFFLCQVIIYIAEHENKSFKEMFKY